MKCIINNSPQYPLRVCYDEKYIKESVNTKFVVLLINNSLDWKYHIYHMIPKLCGACYAVRFMLHISSTDTLKTLYFAYFHPTMKYGIILGGNLAYSEEMFTLQKKTVITIIGAKFRNAYAGPFKRLQISLLPCEYIYSLINFIVNKQEKFQIHAPVHSINKRNKYRLHRPITNLSCLQKSSYAVIKILNILPCKLLSLKNEKAQFKPTLKIYL
jgi:hypothetical protein